MTSTADAALAELTQPGRTPAFCDETDLTTVPTETNVSDIHAWVAAILPSSSYPALAADLVAYRVQHRLPEFHGTEVVNPKSGAPWKAIPFDRRVDAYRFACGLVATHMSELRYSYIGKEKCGSARPASGEQHRRADVNQSYLIDLLRRSRLSSLSNPMNERA